MPSAQGTITVRRRPLDGKDGQSSFKSIVFKRSRTVPDTPTGGSYANPVPKGWNDGVPGGSVDQIWMSTRVFTSDGLPPQTDEWTVPQMASTNADVIIKFSSVVPDPKTPSTFSSYWHDVATEDDIWMAVRKRSNGIDSDWSICKIKGEKGDPGTPGRDGSQGLDGVILWPSEWAENIAYRNETSKTTSPRYVDVVYIQNKSLASGWEAYICKEGHTSTTTNKPSGSTTEYWEKVSNFSAIMAPIILGKNSFINFMQGNRIQIENANGTVAAGMCAVESSTANTVIWAGQTYANRASAPFRVDSAGKMTATGAMITGDITASSGQIAGLKIAGNSLTNDGFSNDATIILRNDNKNTYVAIGGNVLPVEAGMSSVGRFENKLFLSSGTNYGMVIDAHNALNNTAIAILAGCISGLALKTKIITKTSNANITLDRDVGCVYVDTTNTSGTRDVYITLPTMEHYDDGHVIKIKRGNGAGNEVYIKPGTSKWNTLATSGTSWVHHTGSSFIISDNNTVTAGASGSLKIDSEGDAMEFVYFRDLSVTQNGTEYRGGWIQFKNPRTW